VTNSSQNGYLHCCCRQERLPSTSPVHPSRLSQYVCQTLCQQHILRYSRLEDDLPVLIAARQEARQNFDKNRRPAVDTGMQINHAIEVANILRHNIVQGSREQGDESAKWGMFFFPRLCPTESLWQGNCLLTRTASIELNIHDQIERGDNDSIKVGDQDVKIHKACSS
jgi:complex III assembly factor LYRM7